MRRALIRVLAVLAALLPLAATGRVRVDCPANILPAGGSVTCTARLDEAPGATFTWSLPEGQGTVTDGGVFTAPVLEEARILRVRATASTGAWGEVQVLVLRDDPAQTHLWQILGQVMGAEAARAFSADGLPFLDPATGRREGGLRTLDMLRESPPWEVVAGYGLRAPLRWDPGLAGKDGLQLTYREEGHWVRHNVTGRTEVRVQVTGTAREAALEGLRCIDPRLGLWSSLRHPGRILVRGVVAHAGNPDSPGHRDGAGAGARFTHPAGLARRGDPREGADFALADEGAHVIRTLDPEGRVATLCGAPGEAGFLDGPGTRARFRGPTFLAARPRDGANGVLGRNLVVADTGNHAIRVVDARGVATTVAGDGTPGFADAERARDARFRDPRGVAVDTDGNIYVADAGNGAIRRISARGRVTTLAGGRGAGSQDGLGEEASFLDLKGLAWMEGGLYAVDGHAVRHIDARGQVRTLVGRAGEAAADPGLPASGYPLGDGPAFHDPWGIAGNGRELLVTESGGHMVRRLARDPQVPQAWVAHPLAGDPGRPEIRWGLLRLGRPWPLLPAYGSLLAPRGIAFDGEDGALVATGACVVRLSQCGREGLDRQLTREPGTRAILVRPGRPFLVSVHPVSRAALQSLKPVCLWILEVATPTGEPVGGPQVLDEPEHFGRGFECAFATPGDYEMRISAVACEGLTHVLRVPLRVMADDGPAP
ncbi:MAG TPA: hypothetical protein VK188_03390 [Holophaga sp.]|nr:hypothetical protein [Holophaga sp.]